MNCGVSSLNAWMALVVSALVHCGACSAADGPEAKAAAPSSTAAAPVRETSDRHSIVNFTSAFELRQALMFYIVNGQDKDFTIQLRWQDENQTEADRPRLIRVFDPQENLILRHDEPCEQILRGSPLPHYKIDLPVEARGQGVYQVVVSGFGGPLDFSLSRAMSWGVLGSSKLAGRGDQFSEAYIFLPPRLESLPIRCEGTFEQLTLKDESGGSKVEIRPPGAGGAAILPADGEHVWKLSIQSRGEYRLDFGGLPIILCPDEVTARAIGASVDVLEDGTICFHKFQIKVQQILGRYRQLPAGVFAVQPPPLLQYKDQWLAQAARHDLLLGGSGVYAALPVVLHAQNLDPASPWFGTIGQKQMGNPWQSYTRLGLKRVAEHAAVLAAVHRIAEPFNPLYQNQVLRHRVIIAAMQELMLLREHEMPMDIVSDTFFGDDRAFIFGSFLRAFPLMAEDCPAEVREVWTEGLRRYVDHESISQVASTVNQWSFIIVGLQHFFDGSGEPIYQAIVQRHLQSLYTRSQWGMGQMPAGYFFEAGIDATYNGITLHHLAYISKQTGDAKLRESLRRCIDLFNHTIAPQTDGTLLGASSFCCRTPGDWTVPQFGGGLAMLADDLAEAAPLADRVWPTIRSLSRNAKSRSDTEQALAGRLHYLEPSALRNENSAASISYGPEIHFSIWQHFAALARQGDLPMVAERDFTRNFGDEFFCVRRPSYYAFIYAGKPMPEWLKDERPTDPRKQHPRNGGGLCMFWSPVFGSSILAKNWSAYAAQTIIAEFKGGASWEDYWSVTNSFDAERGEAVVTGTMMNQPIDFRKQYRFGRDRVECDLMLTANRDAAFDAMWECFPYPNDASLHLNVTLVDEQGRAVNNRPASAIVFRNGSPEAHVIVFAQPRQCRSSVDRSTDHYGKPREHGRVLVELPKEWSAGQERTVRWCIMAVPVDQVAEAIRDSIAAMQR